MRILIIADEVWNDYVNGNNVLTNWFQDFPAEFAEIYATPGRPYNSICKLYFRLTDGEMLGSIFSRQKVGTVLNGDFSMEPEHAPYNSTDIPHLDFARKHMGNLVRALKTIVWNIGRIDEARLRDFVTEFNPDIVFSTRFAHSKILRLEKLVSRYADCPVVAFTGDNEYSLRRFSLSPLFWCNLFYQRRCLKKAMPRYSLYYTLSETQITEYQQVFDVPMKVLRKCSPKPMGDFKLRPVGEPIQIVYGGKLYAGREKTLIALADAIRDLNATKVYYQLHIYTPSKVTNVVAKKLNDGVSSFIHQPVNSEELEAIYHRSDIALSVESFGLAERLATRVSFSTKLIDCLYSTCAVMIIGWDKNSGYEYLRNQNAAICINDISGITPTLRKILDNKEIIQRYKLNAYRCMVKNHSRETIQHGIYSDFLSLTDKHNDGGVLS